MDVIDALSHATGLRALEVLMAQRLCTTPCSRPGAPRHRPPFRGPSEPMTAFIFIAPVS